ncbi:Uncharacterized protein CG43427 [Anthophora quadrimaculata]
MPASQTAATERRNDRMITHEPPKLKTTLKTPPKQATNPLQFVKVGPCSLYRTAQEQLQKVQEVKKIKQEVRDDPEDWQSNLDNWKSSRRKRQEHIIERVVEVKKLELEEHDRQRRRSKTFSEMMEERGNRGRKLSISLAMYHEEDANDLSDLGIGTSSGKSSVSGDTHDDTHSVLSDRDSEIEKNHSDVDNNVPSKSVIGNDITTSSSTTTATTTTTTKKPFGNGFHSNHSHNNQEYDSATTATTSSPEPEEYTYEGAIRGYVSRVSQNIPRRSLASLDAKLDNAKSSTNGSKTSLNEDTKSTIPVVKVDILKRREIFEKASQKSNESKMNRLSGDFTGTKSIKERLSNLEKQKHEAENNDKTGKALNRLSGDMSTIRERLSHLEKQASERENKSCSHRKLSTEELETVRPLRERLSTLEKYSSSDESSAPGTAHESRHNGELSARTIKDRLSALDAARSKESTDKRSSVGKHSLCFRDQENRIDTSTPSERSSSPDSEYRVPRAAFHRSLDSLDADASSGPDTFERVQSLEELDYGRRYPASSSSAELLNDTDREDSGIHTADVSCSVSQADEPVDEDIVHASTVIERQEVIEEKPEEPREIETPSETITEQSNAVSVNEISTTSASQPEAVVAKKGTADTSGELSTNKSQSQAHIEVTNSSTLRSCPATSRPIVYQSPKVPPRRTPPETLPKPKLPASKEHTENKIDSMPVKDSNSVTSNTKLFTNEQESMFGVDEKSQNVSIEDSFKVTSTSTISLDTAVVDSCPLSSARTAAVPTNLQLESNATSASNCSAKEVPKTTPVTSPRAASKIPTPLPRKTIGAKSSPTSSTSSLSPPVSPSSPKIPSSKTRTSNVKSPTSPMSSPQFPKASEIPIPVCSNVTSSTNIPISPSSNLEQSPLASPGTKHPVSLASSTKHQVTVAEETLAAERRRTVVEICEKVVVPQGKTPTTPPVTPFITVDRVNEKQSSATEEPIVIEKADDDDGDDEEATVICQPSPPVEHEEHEEKEAAMNGKIESYEQPARKSINESIDVHDAPETEPVDVPVPERPTTLTLNKQEITMVDTMSLLSSVSPISTQILPLNLSSDEEIVSALAFPLGPPTSAEPPTEKPPPPPVDISDEENLPLEPLKRLNSTRRIKKELRTRRSDFLGIEGVNDDDLERELTLTKPPDMAAILAEERRIEQLHRRSYDTDSNYEQDSSHERDSGVELGHAEDWTKQPVSPDMSQHSRQSSEPFGASVTSSEEDEITKKEREIIEVLEKEEQWRYGNNRELNSDLGEKLAHKLRELEEEKMQLERERAQEAALRRQEETLRKNEDNIRKQEETLRKQQEEAARQQEAARVEAEAKRAEEKRREEEELRAQAERLRIQNELEEERRVADARRIEEKRIRAIENQIREQENTSLVGAGLNDEEDEFASGEVLRVERELLQLEQEELKRQRNNLAYREQKQLKLAEQLQEQWKSLQDVAHTSATNIQQYKSQPPVNYRSSMPNLQLQDVQRRRPPPPPIPPAKPLRLIEQRQRDVMIRSSRIPSADSIPQQVDASLRHSASVTTLSSHAGQQMSRQTLQALSAVPRPRIVQSDQWVQRRKSDVPRGAHDLNYQHWLIQEAEQRRISEKNQRSPARKPQMHVTGTSVPYTMAPTRTDSKPLPDSIIQTLTQRVQNRAQEKPLPPRRRLEHSTSQEHLSALQHQPPHVMPPQKSQQPPPMNNENQEKMLSVSGKKKCSHCGDELGRGAAMIIESLRLFYHMECFKCCVCHVRLGDGLMGTDVRVRNDKLHCHNCYSSDDGVKFSCV